MMLLSPINTEFADDVKALKKLTKVHHEYLISPCTAVEFSISGNLAKILFHSSNQIFDDETNLNRISDVAIFHKNVFRHSDYYNKKQFNTLTIELRRYYNISGTLIEIDDDFEGGGPCLEFIFIFVLLFIVKNIATGFLKKLGELLFTKINEIKSKAPMIKKERDLCFSVNIKCNNNIILLNISFTDMPFDTINREMILKAVSIAEGIATTNNDVDSISIVCSDLGVDLENIELKKK